jgi:hypothetical protein
VPGGESRQCAKGGCGLKIWKLKNPIYHVTTFLIICPDREEVRKKLARKYPGGDFSDVMNSDACCFWADHKQKRLKHYFIWLPKFHLRNSFSWASLVHEFYHLVGLHLKDRGVNEEPWGEAGAYYYDFMFQQAVEILLDMRKKKARKQKGKNDLDSLGDDGSGVCRVGE